MFISYHSSCSYKQPRGKKKHSGQTLTYNSKLEILGFSDSNNIVHFPLGINNCRSDSKGVTNRDY